VGLGAYSGLQSPTSAARSVGFGGGVVGSMSTFKRGDAAEPTGVPREASDGGEGLLPVCGGSLDFDEHPPMQIETAAIGLLHLRST